MVWPWKATRKLSCWRAPERKGLNPELEKRGIGYTEIVGNTVNIYNLQRLAARKCKIEM